MIAFDRTVCTDLASAQKLEWLETNGLGGFSSSTIVGLNTRRYHGLLTAATRPPVGRTLLLSKLEETFVIGGRGYDLSANQYPGSVYPQGHRYLKHFRLDPFPVFVYEVEGVEIEKRVFMVHGENSTVIEYELGLGAPECFLEARPLIAFRDYHATTHWNGGLNSEVQTAAGLASVSPYAGLPTLYLAHNAEAVEKSGNWYYNFEYAVEKERGLDFREDLFNPFSLRFRLRAGVAATVIASTQVKDAGTAGSLREREIQRRGEVVKSVRSRDPLVVELAAAADQFIVKRGELNSVIAGYHWFGDWGRDTMISLPGLTLATGRPEIARNVLQAFAESADQGMLPNRFPDAGETPEYNTVDAALWLFEAVRSYLNYTGDSQFVRQNIYPKLKEIVDWHIRGTRYHIRVDTDGLLACGEPGVQLTWMDAKVGDWVVTPRLGKPVEIQALWYNAVRVLADLSDRFGDESALLNELADSAKQSFHTQFWNAGAGCLYDVVNLDQRDAAIRPNQIFAVSLHHSMLSPERAKQVVAVVQRELFTPLGLRTLSPRDPNYHARYEGGVLARDSAYHQGTVWPWLMGPFITAYVRVNGATAECKAQTAEWLKSFADHLRTAGLGQISEILDGDLPHEPRGCIAQAWSVAELLRAGVEDVYGIAKQERSTDSLTVAVQ
jgi:predicted glycogen debranching enzyme